MFGRKRPLEEKIGAAISAEFASLIAELEKNLREYRSRLELKTEAWSALEKAEAEARTLYLARITLKKRFWEAYYGKDEALLSEVGSELRSLERTVKKAEKSLRKARANFERVDFDEVAEGAVLREKADAAQEKADLRVGTLEETLEHRLAETWREAKEASKALRDECAVSSFRDVSNEDTAYERTA